MVSINYSSREVCCKIVYYGPGLSGKTTNLQYIHSKVPQTTRGKLISLATEADRTLFFDFLPINIGNINGLAAKFQLYTVPGQVYYNATRKLVLRGVDGVCFVADSQPDKMDENIESLSNLEENLKEYGYDINDMPIVLQYNKRDLPGILSVEEMNRRLNPRGLPIFEASASIGNGVFDTLKLIIKLVLDKAKSTNVKQTRVLEASAQIPTTQSQPENQPAAQTDYSTSPSASQSNTVVASQTEAPRPAPVSDVTYRPYPGSAAAETQEKKISPSNYAPQQTEGVADATLEKTVTNNNIVSGDDSGGLNRPIMAPSLKRKRETKKRGFFKRLFGIK